MTEDGEWEIERPHASLGVFARRRVASFFSKPVYFVRGVEQSGSSSGS